MPGMIDLKRRIKSVQSTRKITRAMQLVSAAKMRKAQGSALASRTYASLAWELILNLSKSEGLTSSLLRTYPRAERIAFVIITGNRGFVGSLNTNLVQKVRQEIDSSGLEADIITAGRKGRDWAVHSGREVLADFEKYDRTIAAEEIYPLAHMITDLYKTGKYRKVIVAYNHFVSTISQKPTMKQILPFAPGLIKQAQAPSEEVTLKGRGYNYLFEPTAEVVFNHLLPRIIESQVYQTILESDASEHSARMIMMKNATDAAGDLIDDLTLTYNKLRQNKITTELAEITAGKIALE